MLRRWRRALTLQAAVSGALSFMITVLWGLTGTHPRVPDGGWNTAGVVVGPKRWAVWRVFDAQWFGVAQRRRRIFVVAGAGGPCRPEILFESEGMFGGVAPSRTPGEEVAGTLGGGTPGGGPRTDTDRMTFVKAKRAQSVEDDETWEPNRPAPTLNQFDNNHETRATVLTVYGMSQHAGYTEGVTTLTATDHKRPEQNIAITDAVRRLTPIECERLMGWPDNWTATTADGKQQADSHRYRQCGNGVATPVTQWIGNRLNARNT